MQIVDSYNAGMPYCIIAKNSDDNTHKIKIFGSNEMLSHPDWTVTKEGSLVDVNRSVQLSSGTPGVGYASLLHQVIYSPFSVGHMYISVLKGDWRKIFKYASSHLLTTKDGNGHFVGFNIDIVLSPYQMNNELWTSDQPFNVDGFTSLEFKLPPDSEISIRYYLSKDINPARALVDKPVLKTSTTTTASSHNGKAQPKKTARKK